MKEYIYSMPDGGDESKGWAILSVCWAFVAFATFTTILRVFVRAKLTHNLGSDDWVMMVALFTTILGGGLITSEILVGGLGRHSYYLTPSQRRNFAAIGWADWIQTFITLALMKISICLFLMRIVDSKPFRWALWGLVGFLCVFTGVSVFLFLGVCRPLKAYWDTEIRGATCLNEWQVENVTLAQGILSAFTDIILSLLPLAFLYHLRVSFRIKLALCVLMGLGIITAVCAIVRSALSGALTNPDLTWAISANVAWRLPEVNIGIACANAPVLRPLYLFLRGRLDTSRSKSGASGGGASKDRFVMPANARWYGKGSKGGREGGSTTLQGSEGSVGQAPEKYAGGSGIGVEESIDLELGPQVPPKEGFGTRSDAWA